MSETVVMPEPDQPEDPQLRRTIYDVCLQLMTDSELAEIGLARTHTTTKIQPEECHFRMVKMDLSLMTDSQLAEIGLMRLDVRRRSARP